MGAPTKNQGCNILIGIVVALLLPPLIVFVIPQPNGKGDIFVLLGQLGLLVILTILFYVPGVILAFFYMYKAYHPYD
jgi:uncharacterized membrane protein YqaE (UPF0057 family)